MREFHCPVQTGVLTMASPRTVVGAPANASSCASQSFGIVRQQGHRPLVAAADRQAGSDEKMSGWWQGLTLTLRALTVTAGSGTPSEEAGAASLTPSDRQQSQARCIDWRPAPNAAGSAAAPGARLLDLPPVAGPRLGLDVTGLQLVTALAQYPEGARVLHAANRDFLLVPLSNVVDESYTGYLDMVSRHFPTAEA